MLLDAHAHQALHQALHFIGVAGAHVEDVARVLAQRGCARERRHIRHTRFFHQGQDGGVVGRAHARQQRKGRALADHLLDVVDGALGHIAVVHHVQLQGAAVHAAACVDLGDGRLGALAQVGAKTGQRAAEGGRAADGERLATDAALLGKGIAHKGGCRKGSGGVRDKLATLHGKGSGYKGGCGVARSARLRCGHWPQAGSDIRVNPGF
jgi:hypothetical protein